MPLFCCVVKLNPLQTRNQPLTNPQPQKKLTRCLCKEHLSGWQSGQSGWLVLKLLMHSCVGLTLSTGKPAMNPAMLSSLASHGEHSWAVSAVIHVEFLPWRTDESAMSTVRYIRLVYSWKVTNRKERTNIWTVTGAKVLIAISPNCHRKGEKSVSRNFKKALPEEKVW